MGNNLAVQIVSGLIVSLITVVTTALSPKEWLIWISNHIPIELNISILLFFITTTIIFFYKNRSLHKKLIALDKKRVAFGILWDKDQQAFCPQCKLPMADYDSYGKYALSDEKVFMCPHCQTQYRLMDHTGSVISLINAQAHLRESQ